MRGLHQQSSPGWPNQSLLLLSPLSSFTSILSIHSTVIPPLPLISHTPCVPLPNILYSVRWSYQEQPKESEYQCVAQEHINSSVDVIFHPMMYPLCLFTIIAASLPFPYVGVCIFACLTINTMCVSGWCESWDEICSKAQNVHFFKK